MAPSEELLKDQVEQARRDVEADITELKTELAAVQKKLAVLLLALGSAFVLFKIGRALWRRSRDVG